MFISIGDYDCMDWSDELLFKNQTECSFEPNAMECDGHICSRFTYSCGDGTCVLWTTRMAFQRFIKAGKDCYTKRNLNYMCEVSLDQPAWTLANGLCWPDAEICEYLAKCDFSDGFEKDCSCVSQNCSQLMMDFCRSLTPTEFIRYPSDGLINPNLVFFHSFTGPLNDSQFIMFAFGGSIRCRGYQLITDTYIAFYFNPFIISDPYYSKIHCGWLLETRNCFSSYQLDEFCWNETVTFNGRPYIACNRIYVMILAIVYHSTEFVMECQIVHRRQMKEYTLEKIIV